MSKMTKNPAGIVRELHRRMKRVREKNGTSGLIKSVFWFLVYPFYESAQYILFVKEVEPEYSTSERRPNIGTNKLTFKVVTSNQEADKLEAEGYNFRKYANEFNNYLKRYTWLLDCGLIACCTFVEKEFAAISWVALSKQVQDAIKAPPVKIDYENNEILARGMWVNPKYRGMELYRYTVRNRDKYLANRGVKRVLGPADYINKAGIGVAGAVGSKEYGRGRSIRILWWKSWRESRCKQ
jgi:hypothetical protein